MSGRNFVLLLVAIAVTLLCVARGERNPAARDASRGFRLIDDLSLVGPPSEELLAGAVRGMVGVLGAHGDEHSAFVEPAEAQPLREEMQQEFGGIGVRLGVEGEPPRPVVADPPEPGGPADRAGLRAGDRLVAVDGTPIAAAPIERLVATLRGNPGEALELTVERAVKGGPPEELRFSMVREVIRVPSVIGDRRDADGAWRFRLEADPRIAHVRITTFGNRTTVELAEGLATLVAEGAEGIVLDLRENGGGALDAAVEVSDLFLPADAAIVSTRGRDGRVVDSWGATSSGDFETLPVVVLVDRNTASASEIVAAALQDHGRARVVGERSFGKGTVQQLLALGPGNGLLKLTAASYWRPSGVNIHRLPGADESAPWGVTPDEGLVVEQSEERLVTWAKWRRQRDLRADTSAGDAASDPTDSDPMLCRAVETLVESLEPLSVVE
ncbi:MAG: S41 family peptidase [Lacipirellulaceae bacterium]